MNNLVDLFASAGCDDSLKPRIMSASKSIQLECNLAHSCVGIKSLYS